MEFVWTKESIKRGKNLKNSARNSKIVAWAEKELHVIIKHRDISCIIEE